MEPSGGRVECGGSAREGVTRALGEEAELPVGPAALACFLDPAGEPVEGQYTANVDFAVPRSETTGNLEPGSDAADARFRTPAE